MSFRISRSRNIEPSLNRRRSLSQSRLESSTPTSSWSSRPLSGSYYNGGTVANLRNQYQNKYGSKESLYSPTSRKSFFSNGYSSGGHYSNGNDSRYGSNSSLYGNSYADRYVSPYSNYDNGVTTAGLSLSLGASGLNSYSSGRKRDYTPSRSSNLLSSSSLGGSNTNLNSYSSAASANISRSQSFRDTDRKSRSRTRSRGSASMRSMSASSEKSEGYESGNEQPSSRSRLQSASSVDQTAESKSDVGDVEENGELIDYKALYEASRVEIENLKMQLQKKEETLHSTKAALERFTNATTKNSLSELEKRERRAMERRMSEMEEELKLLQKFKTENERLRAENRALTRVVSKLTTSAQNQLHGK